MNKFLRFTSLATVAALTLTAAPAFAGPATATADPQAKAQVRVLKPLALKQLDDLDLGTVALGQGTFTATVGIDQAGDFTCDAAVTCSGNHKVARYNVNGTNTRVVKVSADDVEMSAGSAKLTLVVDAPATVTLPDTGTDGVDFAIGGSVELTDATPDGLYVGDFNVTADYQ